MKTNNSTTDIKMNTSAQNNLEINIPHTNNNFIVLKARPADLEFSPQHKSQLSNPVGS
jgi:hypothetical protein